MASAPPAISAVARPSRMRSTALDDRGQARRLLVAHRQVGAAEAMLETRRGWPRRWRRCCRRAARARPTAPCGRARRGTAASIRRRRVHVPRTTPRRIVAFGRNRRAGILERELGGGDRIDAGAIHPAQLHRRNPRGGVEPGDLAPRGSSGSRPCRTRVTGDDAAAAFEQGIAEGRVRGAERRDDADA